MSDSLDIHEASASEKLQSFRNAHEPWGGDLDLDSFLAIRRRSPSHNWARWFVGTLRGEVVCSMAWYPVRLRIGHQIENCVGVGAVLTRSEFRRKGYAATMLKQVLEQARSEGAGTSVLFSDINPAYYARMGYVQLPSPLHVCSVSDKLPSKSVYLERIEPGKAIGQLALLHETFMENIECCFARDEEYWSIQVHKLPVGDYYLLRERSRERACGYARVLLMKDCFQVEEYAVREMGLEPLLFEHLHWLAAQHGCAKIESWLPPTSSHLDRFELKERQGAWAMVASLDPTVDAAEWVRLRSHFWLSDHF